MPLAYSLMLRIFLEYTLMPLEYSLMPLEYSLMPLESYYSSEDEIALFIRGWKRPPQMKFYRLRGNGSDEKTTIIDFSKNIKRIHQNDHREILCIENVLRAVKL